MGGVWEVREGWEGCGGVRGCGSEEERKDGILLVEKEVGSGERREKRKRRGRSK